MVRAFPTAGAQLVRRGLPFSGPPPRAVPAGAECWQRGAGRVSPPRGGSAGARGLERHARSCRCTTVSLCLWLDLVRIGSSALCGFPFPEASPAEDVTVAWGLSALRGPAVFIGVSAPGALQAPSSASAARTPAQRVSVVAGCTRVSNC